MFVHFLITRFNIVQDWYTNANRNHSNIQTEEWLTERFRLFKQYCFPSVANQDTDNFIWFVLFNSETPEKYKDEILFFSKECKMFHPLYLEPYGAEGDVIYTAMERYLNDETTHVITTRLDNDDMIRSDYISMIQSAYKEQFDDVFFNYAHGIQFDESKKVLYNCPNQDQGHYISRIVLKENRRNTVLVDHSKVASLAQYIEMDISTGPAWIETVHKCNAWNRIDCMKPIAIDNTNAFPTLHLSKCNYSKSLLSYFITSSYRYIKRKVEKHIIHRLSCVSKSNK